jgi:hypothetical protein
MNESSYKVSCDCGSVELSMTGYPKIKAYCHCEDCRNLLQVPFHSVCVWDKDKVTVTHGQEYVGEFQHPTKKMARYFCKIVANNCIIPTKWGGS